MAKNSTPLVQHRVPPVLQQRVTAWVRRLAFTLAAMGLALGGRSAEQGTTAARRAITPAAAASAVRSMDSRQAGPGTVFSRPSHGVLSRGTFGLPDLAIAMPAVTPRSPQAFTPAPGVAQAAPAQRAAGVTVSETAPQCLAGAAGPQRRAGAPLVEGGLPQIARQVAVATPGYRAVSPAASSPGHSVRLVASLEAQVHAQWSAVTDGQSAPASAAFSPARPPACPFHAMPPAGITA